MKVTNVYNVTSSAGIQQATSTDGPRWLVPRNTPEPRIVQFSVRVTF